MPVYEYECQACHKEFEYQQRMSDPDKTVCEACGGALERIISRTAFQLKGSGWYKDLYASSKPAAAESKGEDSKPAETKSDAKSDAKSDGGGASTSTTPSSTSTSTSTKESGGGGGGGTSKAAASAQ